jgi:hypothetical protein
MKIASGHLAESSGSRVAYSATPFGRTQLYKVKSVLVFVASAAAILYGLLWLPLTFAEGSVQTALDILSWCLVGALATFLLMLGVRIIDGLLDV